MFLWWCAPVGLVRLQGRRWRSFSWTCPYPAVLLCLPPALHLDLGVNGSIGQVIWAWCSVQVKAGLHQWNSQWS